jgi:hypothetical protein
MPDFFSTLPYSKTLRQLGSIACVALFLAACSSGGGDGGGGTPPAASAIISGTAAAGAPVVGFVAVRDSSTNPQPVRTNIPIEANGHYSVDVSGLTAPFAFLASGTVGGKTVSLYSAATQADVGGTINITPFTDLIIRNIAASAVDGFINNGNFSNLTKTQLDAQRVLLTNQLAPALTAMGLSSSIDLLRATFNADSTGLDRFMDVVKVSTTPTTATITNILDAANALIIDTTTGATTGIISVTGLAPTGTSIDQITQNFRAFANFFATGLPNPADPNLVALFSNTFLEDGEDSSAFLTDITTDPFLIGLKISSLVVDSVNTTAGTAQVHFIPQDAAGQCLAHDVVGCSLSWQMVKNGSGPWQIAGNQRIARVSVRTHATRNICASNTNCQPVGTTTYATGLSLNINNEGLQSIGSAVVTGPGLPNGGVTLTAQVNFTWFAFPSPLCQGCTTDLFTMTDQQIALVVPNSTYTVQLFNLSGTPISGAIYTEVVPVPPVLNAALATLAYPSITSSTQNLAGITTATLTPSWNIPAGLFGDILSVFVFQTDLVGQNLQNLNVRADVRTNGTATSGTSTLVIPAPTTGGSWTNGGYSIHAWDQYTGVVSTHYQ